MPDQTAIDGLTQCLAEMGRARSNPVLEILSHTDSYRQNVKYPTGNLKFPGMGLRAYYHNHGKPYLRENEHGHFHIFILDKTSSDTDYWRHLAALSMDNVGQARSWFCVNNWVTGGKWLSSELAQSRLLKVFRQDPGHLLAVEKWIFYMLAIYFSKIMALLEKRDTFIDTSTNTGKPIFDDRSVYDLAEISIDLLADISIMVEEKGNPPDKNI